MEILKENLDRICSRLDDSGASFVSIIAVMGTSADLRFEMK